MINTLQPLNIILFNIYLIMTLQLLLNWSEASCNHHSNLFQLVFIITMITRLILQESFLNKIIKFKTYKSTTLISSGVVLTGFAIYQAIILGTNPSDYDYNPENKATLTCFQNRIIFVSEIVLCFLTVIKDILFVICGK